MSATARERFVEAMRYLMEVTTMDDHVAYAGHLCDAFADATCKERACSDEDHWGEAGVCLNDEEHSHRAHEACRASLRKECGL